MPPSTSNRLYTLDVLRGFAALCVVFWHWQHFFYVGSTPAQFDPTLQPLFSQFKMLYQHGGMAVQLRISEHRDRPFRLIVTGHFANA